MKRRKDMKSKKRKLGEVVTQIGKFRKMRQMSQKIDGKL